MAKAVRYHKQGGPEVLQLDDVQVGEPGAGQVRIRHTAIGVNFVDTYQRSGLYPMQLPAVAGNEAAGVVDAVGPDVKDLKKGDRIAYTGLPGSYCEQRIVPADRMVKIPEGISDDQAASMIEKIFWKIDYYDPELKGWCDPLAPQCRRVMTVMLASEY